MALVTSKPGFKAPLIILTGIPGAGKTTLGAMFPKPVFIQAEEATDVFDTWMEEDIPDVLPPLPLASVKSPKATSETIIRQLHQLTDEDHDFETCVIDSASVLNSMLERQMCVTYGVENIAEAAGGYGKGFVELGGLHYSIIEAANELRSERNMGVIVLCHLDVVTLKNRPDSDPVVTYGLQLEKRAQALWCNNASAVMALRMDEFVRGTEKDRKGRVTKAGKVVMSGERELVTDASTMGFGLLCKNRWDLPATIKMPPDSNPLLDLIPFYSQK